MTTFIRRNSAFHRIFLTFSENCDIILSNLVENSDKHCSQELGDTNTI